MSNQSETHKYVLPRHKFFVSIVKPGVKLFLSLKNGYHTKSKYKIKKGESVVVLSNHQTDYDPLAIAMSFNENLYTLGTDTIFHGVGGKLLKHCFGTIPKRKGQTDIASVSQMLKVVREGGSLLFFPEGNRSYAEFQFFISENLPKIMKSFKSTIILFNLHGGTGINPRWGDKHKRKGSFFGEIRDIIPYEEYKNMPDDELYLRIKNGIRVFDSESGDEFKCKARAQYLEEMLFVCPKCGKTGTLFSHDEHISCTNCGLDVIFTEKLTLESEDPDFKFHILNDWYQYQKKWLKEYEIKEGEVVFSDKDIALYLADPNTDRKLLYEGSISLTDKELIFNDEYTFILNFLRGASTIRGDRFNFTYDDHLYLVVGKERFNPLKYVMAFNKLESGISRLKLDSYFNLED